MRGQLSGIRRRVDQLARDATLARCGGNHTRTKVSVVHGDEPKPEWPEAASGERCACGSKLKYVHVIHQLYPGQSRKTGHRLPSPRVL